MEKYRVTIKCCIICEEQFSHYNLKKHIQTIQATVVLYCKHYNTTGHKGNKCELCGKSFTQVGFPKYVFLLTSTRAFKRTL